MSFFILPLLFCVIFFFDRGEKTRKEKIIYRTIVAIALLLSIPASFTATFSDLGASLSGLVSVFSALGG